MIGTKLPWIFKRSLHEAPSWAWSKSLHSLPFPPIIKVKIPHELYLTFLRFWFQLRTQKVNCRLWKQARASNNKQRIWQCLPKFMHWQPVHNSCREIWQKIRSLILQQLDIRWFVDCSLWPNPAFISRTWQWRARPRCVHGGVFHIEGCFVLHLMKWCCFTARGSWLLFQWRHVQVSKSPFLFRFHLKNAGNVAIGPKGEEFKESMVGIGTETMAVSYCSFWQTASLPRRRCLDDQWYLIAKHCIQ